MRPVEVSLELPPFPLEPRCFICQTWHTDRELFEWVNQALIDGRRYSEIFEHVGDKIPNLTYQKLATHKGRHLLPYIWRAMEYRDQLQAFRDTFAGTDTDPAVLLSFRLFTEASRLLDSISQQELRSMNLADRVQFVFRVTELLTTAQRGEAQNRLAELRLELQKRELESREEAIRTKLVAYLRAVLKDEPAILEKLTGLLAAEGGGERSLPEAT